MKLTNRLAAIASKVSYGSVVADIGTDHAYIPAYLVRNKICQHIIATDINIGPLNRARKYITENGLEQNIETRLGAGLKPLKYGEVDTIIIAGMGGVLIQSILEEGKDLLEKVDTLILQPMIGQEAVREWLYNNAFRIIDEALAKEGDKLYTVIIAKHGVEKDKPSDFEIGDKLIEKNDPLLEEYLGKKIIKLKKVLHSLKDKESENVSQRKKECQEKLDNYVEILNKLNYNKK